MKNQFKFKPFDKVLVRDHNQHAWKAGIYSHSERVRGLDNNPTTVYVCTDNIYKQCIPYNEETAHLIGTDKPYREPKWRVISHEPNDIGECTDEELLSVIKNMIHFPIFKDLTIKKIE